MLDDVLEAIGEARSIERTIVVSGEPARAGARRRGAAPRWSPTPTTSGHVEAALAGIARAEARGAELRRPAPRRLPAARPARARPPADRRARALRRDRPRPPRHRHQRPRARARRTRSSPPSARAAAPATSPPPARPASPSGSRSCPRSALDLDTPADVVALTRELEARPRPRQAHRQGAGHMSAEPSGELASPAPVDAGCPRSSEGDAARRADRRAGAELARRRRRRRRAEGRLQGRGTGRAASPR